MQGTDRIETNSGYGLRSQKLRPTRWEDWIAWGLVALLGLLLIAKIFFSLNIMWQILNYPFQVDESEGMIVAEVEMMSKGVDIFAQSPSDVFISAPYTPLYYWLNWPFLMVLQGSFKPGRIISFIATIGIAFLIYKLTGWYSSRRNGGKPDRLAGIIGAAVWGSLGLVAFWGGAVKPDMTALLFSMLGVWFASKIDLNGKSSASGWRAFIWQERWLYAAAIIVALAAMTKQTAFAAPAAIFFYILLKRPFAALRFLAAYLVLSFGPMLLLNIFSKGGFWWHIVTVHELPWSWYNYWKFASAFIQNYLLYSVVALIFVMFYIVDMLPKLFRRRNPFPTLANEPATLLLGYTSAALIMTVSVGTYGGNHNHLLEFAACMSLCLGLTISRLREWWRKPNTKVYKLAYPVVLLVLMVQVLAMFGAEGRVKPDDFPILGGFEPSRTVLRSLNTQFYDPDWLGLQYRAPLPEQIKGFSGVASYVSNDDGALIYSDNVSLVLPSGKKVFTTDTFTQTHATYFGRWNESKLVQMIKERKFSVILLRESIAKRLEDGRPIQDIYVSPAMAQAILDNYDLTCPDVANIYEPKDKPKTKRCD